MEEQNKKTDWGCLILVDIFVIANLITLFSSDNKDNIAGFGAMILGYAVLGGIFWFLSKYNSGQSNSDNSSGTVPHRPNNIYDDISQESNKDDGEFIDKTKGFIKSCLIPLIIIIIALAIIGPVLSNYSVNYSIGAIAAIALTIGIGVYFYNTRND